MQIARKVLTPDALELLQAVAASGSFAAAARELRLVPSAVTYRVRQIEDALDVLLFDRSSRQARLTEAGAELLREGARLLAEIDAVANRVRRVATGWESQITIVIDDVIARRTVFELCEAFYSRCSEQGVEHGTRLRVRSEVLAGTWEALLSGQADLAIGVGTHATPPAGIEFALLGDIDFVFAVAPHHPLANHQGPISDAELRATVALGVERTMEQDPSFAFRILVDIAIKALSAAINDPTTAVLAIDQLHRLLRRVGLQDLRGERFEDALGQTRVVFRTPNWEDYVHLSCTEIRHCGVGSIQIARRMRAMLENLTQTLPAHRHAELRQQLELLDQAVVGAYTVPADLALARVSDSQGLGGTLGVRPVVSAPANESRTEPREPT